MKDIIKKSKTLTVLYVEDNLDTRTSTLLILDTIFKDVIVSCDGVDGLEKFNENISTIDIVITDISMPIMNGLEMSKKIKNISSEVPIFIFSAHNEMNYFLEAIALGVDGYLLKPIVLKQFVEVLDKSLKNIFLKKENDDYKVNLEKRVDEQISILKDRDKLIVKQSKMIAMGEMIDFVAHQWKQPLHIISMKVELLHFKNPDNEDIKTCCVESLGQIKHLSDTLDEFRDFYRLDTMQDSIFIKSAFDSVLTLLRNDFMRHNIEVDIECDDTIELSINFNDIKHLLINLLNNAKDSLKDLPLNAKKIIKISCIEDNETIKINVKDNSHGIPNNVINKIFNADFTTKSNEGGTGTGLYICKIIVEKYNATIQAYNENGAVFEIVFNKK